MKSPKKPANPRVCTAALTCSSDRRKTSERTSIQNTACTAIDVGETSGSGVTDSSGCGANEGSGETLTTGVGETSGNTTGSGF